MSGRCLLAALNRRIKLRLKRFDKASGSVSAKTMSTPMRRIPLDCCARAASGHAIIPTPAADMNCRLPVLIALN